MAGSSDRYSRQTALGVIGPEGQRRLAAATVLVIGCGALGSMQAELLARAGVGRLVLADRDVLELHNLQRQTLFDERDVRERLPKAVAAARRLRAVNSAIRIEALVEDVTAANILELVRRADLVLDGADNFETRYLINDAAVREGRPWVYGGVLGTGGTVLAVRPGQGPCLRCLFPEPPDALLMQTCETAGVLGAAVAWVAALQVAEALKLLVGDRSESYRLHSLEVWRGAVGAIEVERDPACRCCGHRRFEFLDSGRGSTSSVLCGRNAVQVTPEPQSAPDFALLAERLESLGVVTVSGLVLEFSPPGDYRLVVFPDGRVLVLGTTDPAAARSLVARYLGG